MKEKRTTILILAAITLAALVLRCIHLNNSLWVDEFTARSVSRQPLYTLLTAYVSTNQHPLFADLAHFSMALFGESNWALRLPAMLMGVATVPALYVCARRVTGRYEGLLSAALLAVSYQHVWFSQNARGYSGMALWATLATAMLLDMLRSPRMQEPRAARRTLIAYGIFMALGAYTHLAMVFVLIAHVLVVWVWRRKRQGGDAYARIRVAAPALALATALAVLLHAPMIDDIYARTIQPRLVRIQKSLNGTAPVQKTAQPKTSRYKEWQQPDWSLKEALRGLGRGINGGALVVGLLFLAVGAGSLGRGARRDHLFLALLITPCVMTIIAMALIWHLMFPRFFFFAVGLGTIVLTRGITVTGESIAKLLKMRETRGPSYALAAIVLLACLLSLRQNYAFPKQDIEGALAYIQQHREPGEKVITMWPLLRVFQGDLGQSDWRMVRNFNELEATHPTRSAVWTVYSLPRSVRSFRPKMWSIVQRDFTVVKILPGTLGDGDIYICRSKGNNRS